MTHPSNAIAKTRIVASLSLVALIVASIYFGISAWKWNSDFNEWIDAKPMQLTVDLTKPAIHTAPFKQTCDMAHGQSIYVSLDGTDMTNENIGEHFAGLKGTLTIRNVDGTEVLTKDFHADGVRLWGEVPMLVGFHPFQNGEYNAEIRIDQGAMALRGTAHELYARNELCGLELMPAYVLGAISAVVGVIACIVGTYTVPSIVQHGFRAATFSHRLQTNDSTMNTVNELK